ncbi:hypothetical protein [Martelella limonii]|uniref:hypothetical protein n=1 Tax=Martelella limonii TaxID=1647649 RepID=UPI00158122BD|nr:hypothetical protein [Martelella limonii]
MSERSLRKVSRSVFHDQEPQFTSSDGKEKTWVTRGGNFAVCYSQVEAGASILRVDDPEEHMMILPPLGATATVEAGGESIEADADSLTIIPPGPSRIMVQTPGILVRIMPKKSSDIMELASNADAYSDGAPELAEPDLWPEPRGGYRLRHYPLSRHADPNGPRIQPRAFRSTNMLVNILVHFHTRRGDTNLSPHWHDDFEQASLCLSGTWVHHIRYNWGSVAEDWWPDDHSHTPTPSVVIIPARAIHTSEDIGPDGPESSLYDIFCPPRLDFASKKGFCLNEDDYPLPDVSNAGEIKTGGTLMSWQKPA